MPAGPRPQNHADGRIDDAVHAPLDVLHVLVGDAEADVLAKDVGVEAQVPRGQVHAPVVEEGALKGAGEAVKDHLIEGEGRGGEFPGQGWGRWG